MKEFRQKFIDDASELIYQLEVQLLDFEKKPDDLSIINEIFRVMHTLKGSASMFGFVNISGYTHHLETLYQRIKEWQIRVTTEIISLTFESVDLIKVLLNIPESEEKQYEEKIKRLVSVISSIQNLPIQNVSDENQEITIEKSVKSNIYKIVFAPDPDVLLRGVKPSVVFEELEELGTFKSFEKDTTPKGITDADYFYKSYEIFVLTDKPKGDIEDVFLFFLENEFKISEPDISELESNPDLSDLLAKYAENKKQTVNKTVENIEVTEEPVIETTSAKAVSTSPAIRVNTEKLDVLINLVSELVTQNAHLEIIAKRLKDTELTKAISNSVKLSKNFRDNALEMRLVPIQVITTNFQRLVRELSISLGKQVEFIIQGAETELDKSIVYELENPLMHLIRNSMDHGIEDAEIRKKQNKSEKGVIRFISFYSGNSVFIQIQDDGKGIDPDLIRKKAIEKGIISTQQVLSKQDIYDLIFLPGFSTAQLLTQVSGRGVGMDVVKQKISGLRGEIEVDSEIGLGTSMTIKLPITLSIIDTMMVKIDKYDYLIPANLIEKCIIFNRKKLEDHKNKHLMYNEELVPIIDLREIFLIDKNTPVMQNAIIVNQYQRKYAILADAIVGEHQAVVKPLGFMHSQQEFLSGASILGNGALALILDISKLTKWYSHFSNQ